MSQFFFECPNFFLSVPIFYSDQSKETFFTVISPKKLFLLFFYFFWYIKKIVYLCQTKQINY